MQSGVSRRPMLTKRRQVAEYESSPGCRTRTRDLCQKSWITTDEMTAGTSYIGTGWCAPYSRNGRLIYSTVLYCHPRHSRVVNFWRSSADGPSYGAYSSITLDYTEIYVRLWCALSFRSPSNPISQAWALLAPRCPQGSKFQTTNCGSVKNHGNARCEASHERINLQGLLGLLYIAQCFLVTASWYCLWQRLMKLFTTPKPQGLFGAWYFYHWHNAGGYAPKWYL